MKFSAAILLLSLVQISTCNAQWTPKVVPVTLPQPAAAPAAPKPIPIKLNGEQAKYLQFEAITPSAMDLRESMIFIATYPAAVECSKKSDGKGFTINDCKQRRLTKDEIEAYKNY